MTLCRRAYLPTPPDQRDRFLSRNRGLCEEGCVIWLIVNQTHVHSAFCWWFLNIIILLSGICCMSCACVWNSIVIAADTAAICHHQLSSVSNRGRQDSSFSCEVNNVHFMHIMGGNVGANWHWYHRALQSLWLGVTYRLSIQMEQCLAGRGVILHCINHRHILRWTKRPQSNSRPWNVVST